MSKLPTLEIVSHCYAVELPQYAHALCYQLSSLILYPPTKCTVLMTVCCHLKDNATNEVLLFFDGKIPLKVLLADTPNELGRRSIGRNLAAKSTKADVVWFADVDQVFRGYCLDALVMHHWPENMTLTWPAVIKIHQDHATGDRLLKKMEGGPRVADIDESEFVEKTYNRAIGGVQIVRGDFARRYGYVPDEVRWQTPVVKPFGDFRDDLAYRKFCGAAGTVSKRGWCLPWMFRLRHSVTSYQPSKVTKDA